MNLVTVTHLTTGKVVKVEVTKETKVSEVQNVVEQALGLSEHCVLTCQDLIIPGEQLVSTLNKPVLLLIPNPQGG